ncbi:MAG: murein L,D-transpeptidase catalytic domain family protein [Novosphingobium sp.]|nr:murein L,D-transpeptidase catalytic domain family protein [Novosphingobium sp.]
MEFSRRGLLGAVACSSASLALPRSAALLASRVPTGSPPGAPSPSGAQPSLLSGALAALDRHASRVAQRDRIGVVDFAAPSGFPRFQILDLANGSIASTHLVAHGHGSDPDNSGWVERFSNLPGSNASSRGSFLTAETYVGKHGLSRRLIGLDPENDLADARGIVVHAADYVDAHRAREQGHVGRSQGCFAVSPADIAEVLDRLGPGRLLFAWK